eukprot:6196912-Pleurochrysis_carterae.AAC.2
MGSEGKARFMFHPSGRARACSPFLCTPPRLVLDACGVCTLCFGAGGTPTRTGARRRGLPRRSATSSSLRARTRCEAAATTLNGSAGSALGTQSSSYL